MSTHPGEKVYRNFRGYAPRGVKRVPWRVPAQLVELADADAVCYQSNKRNGGGNGQPQGWIHHFGPGVKMYTNPEGTLLVLAGGRLRVKPEGITG